MDLSGIISKGGNHVEGKKCWFQESPPRGSQGPEIRDPKELYVCLLLGNVVPWLSQGEFSLVLAGAPLAQVL